MNGTDSPRTGRRGADYWSVLVEQRGFIAVFVLSAALTALALTYVFSEKYESYTAISYRVQEVARFKPEENRAMGSNVPQVPFKVIGQTLQGVLTSDAILRDVVKTQKLDQKQRDYTGPWYRVWYRKTKDWLREYAGYAWMFLKFGRIVEEDPTSTAIEELRKNVTVVNRDSYVFHLYVRDSEPERAARVVDQLSDVLANWLLEYSRQPGRARGDQLDGLVKERRQEIEKRRRDIEVLLEQSGVASVSIETERLTENLGSLRLEESRLASEIARARARQASVAAKLEVKQRILGATGAAGSSPEPVEHFPPDWSYRIFKEPSSSPEGVEHIPPDDFKKLASQQVFDGLDLDSLLAKQAALRQTISSYEARLQKLPAIQNRLDSLKLSLAALEREFNLFNDGVQEAIVRASSSVSEVRVLHPATVPSGPVSPIKVYHVLLAGGLGLLVSVGLVYLLDFLGIRWFFAPPRQEPLQPVPTLEQPAPPPAGQPEETRNGG